MTNEPESKKESTCMYCSGSGWEIDGICTGCNGDGLMDKEALDVYENVK